MPYIGAHDLPYLFTDNLRSLLAWPVAWMAKSHDGLGVYNISVLWNWPVEATQGLLGHLGLSYGVILIIFISTMLVVGIVGMNSLLKSYQIGFKSRLLAAIFFVVNPFMLLLVDGGQLNFALAISLLPLTFLAKFRPFKFSILAVLMSFLDIRVIYFLAIILVCDFFAHLRDFKKYLLTGGIFVLFFAAIHAFWILPGILDKPPALPVNYTRDSQVSDLSFAKLNQTLFFYQPHWPKNIFGSLSNLRIEFLGLGGLVLIALFVSKDKNTKIYGLLFLIGVFLAKGDNWPAGNIYIYLFDHLPGFSLFRDPVKFYILINFSLTVLLAKSLHYLDSKFKYSTLIFFAFLMFLIRPIYSLQMTGVFSAPRDEDDYLQAAKLIQSLPAGGVLWIPSKPPLGYSDPNHLSTDALTLLDKRPFAVGTVGSYELLNFLRDATASGQLLRQSGIRYLVVNSLDERRDSLKPEDVKYHELFSNQLKNLKSISNIYTIGDLNILDLGLKSDLFSIKQQTNFVVGSDDLYKNIDSLFETAYVFTDEHEGLINRFGEYPQASLLLNDKTRLDVVGNLIPNENKYYPSRTLGLSPNSDGWWKRDASDLIWWRDFLQEKYNLNNQDFSYGQGWAILEKQGELVVPNTCKTQCELLIRKNQIETGTSTITLDQKNLEFKKMSVHWQDLGLITNDNKIKISLNDYPNVVNAVAIVPSDLWKSLGVRADELLKINHPDSSNDKPKIIWKKINSANYELDISELSSPTSLVFAQNYDSMWSLNGQEPVPVYSLLNMFSIDHNGHYSLLYKPQTHVNKGLVISLLSAGVLFMLVLLESLVYNGQHSYEKSKI